MMVRFSIAGVESVGGATRCEAFVMVDKINDSGIYWAFKENLLQCQYMNKQKKIDCLFCCKNETNWPVKVSNKQSKYLKNERILYEKN